jgi:hypothetical protein
MKTKLHTWISGMTLAVTPTERGDPSMKTIMQTRIYLALVAMFVTLAFVGPAAAELICPAAAQKGVPFHGTIQGAETDVVAFPTLSVDGSGTGIATHLGTFTVSWLITVDISTAPSSSTGTFEFIAANGDHLFTDIVGEGDGGRPVAHITECNTITGGTGRFAGATGEFTIHRVVDLSTGSTSGSFDGTIVIHNAQ